MLLIIGKEDENAFREHPGNVVFLFFEKKSPFTQLLLKTAKKEYFDSASVILDNRGADKRPEIFTFCILFTLKECTKPCKLVKVNYDRHNDTATPTLVRD